MYGRKRRFQGHREMAKRYDALANKICELLKVDEVPASVWDFKTELPYKIKREWQDIKGKVESVRRQAVNAIIQGSAADIMKIALLRLHKLCQQKNWTMNGTVHDEALIDVNREITLADVEEIETAMTGAATLIVPLKVDTELMERWGEGIKKKDWFAKAA